tara:strand:- start:156 stop:482 length:327 start_codon:yes stop_codon:yes gene_type:complete
MRDYINIGSTPCDEDCFPAGHRLARAETEIYCRQLQREFPAGEFTVKAFSHDFGVYHEVVAWFNPNYADRPETFGGKVYAAAFDAEGGGLPNWDKQAKAELATLKETA